MEEEESRPMYYYYKGKLQCWTSNKDLAAARARELGNPVFYMIVDDKTTEYSFEE